MVYIAIAYKYTILGMRTAVSKYNVHSCHHIRGEILTGDNVDCTITTGDV